VSTYTTSAVIVHLEPRPAFHVSHNLHQKPDASSLTLNLMLIHVRKMMNEALLRTWLFVLARKDGVSNDDEWQIVDHEDVPSTGSWRRCGWIGCRTTRQRHMEERCPDLG